MLLITALLQHQEHAFALVNVCCKIQSEFRKKIEMKHADYSETILFPFVCIRVTNQSSVKNKMKANMDVFISAGNSN
jgi:hypothetical protein